MTPSAHAHLAVHTAPLRRADSLLCSARPSLGLQSRVVVAAHASVYHGAARGWDRLRFLHVTVLASSIGLLNVVRQLLCCSADVFFGEREGKVVCSALA
jgi:hypothetical protein